MADEPIIAGVGVMTAVGLSARETAAAVRANTTRFSESALHDQRFEPFTLAEIPDKGLPPLAETLESSGLTSREQRMLRIASAPLSECLDALPPNEPPPGLVLALPENETKRPIDSQAFLKSLATQCGGKFDVKRSTAPHTGRAGGLVALAHAAEAIRVGQAKFMIAGAVDTYRDLYVLGSLDLEKRIKSSAHLDGFIPGEGSAFLLLTSRAHASANNLKALAAVSRVAQAEENGHLYSDQPYRGDGLAAAVTQLVQAGLVTEPIAEVWSSMNGENFWAKEWGVAYLRNHAAFLENHAMRHPADCFGDTGSATGPIMAALAALGFASGYYRSAALVYGSSDRSARAALLLTAL